MRLKRHSMPTFWKMPRKQRVWITRPVPGPHAISRCMTLQHIIRDVLGYAETAKEAKRILNEGKIMVDRKVRKEPRFPVGLMDIIEISELKKAFRVDMTGRGIGLREASAGETGQKLCQISGKKSVKGGVTQLSLHDGRNILIKGAKAYSPMDSVIISLPEQKILRHFRFEPGAEGVIIAGKNVGTRGKIKEIKRRKTMLERSFVTIQGKDRAIQTPLSFVVVGDVQARGSAVPTGGRK